MQKIELSLFTRDEPMKVEGAIDIPLENGSLQLPVYILQNGRGPRLTVVGAQHSCETCGTDAIIRLIRDFRATDPADVHGSVVLIPVGNIPGYPLRAHNTSQYDGTNLNRSYPGRPDGNTSERIAHVIWSIARTGDYVLDLHGGDMNEDIIQYAEMHVAPPAILRKSLEMAACFDLDVVLCSIAGRDYAYPDFRSLYGLAQSNGIPASIVEAGGSGISDQHSIDYFYEGLKKVMVRLGILPGEKPAPRRLWVTRWVSCIERPHRGVFTSFCRTGDHVKRGQPMGQITDYFGDLVDEIDAPRTGVVSLAQSCRGVSEDDLIYMVIDLEDGEYVEV